MTGRIVKAVSDFYYVYSAESDKTYICKAKGIFRKEKNTPLVGDVCEFSLTHTRDIEGNITSISPRKSRLKRPAVANIDQALVVFAIKDPDPGLYLLDRFLVMMESEGLPVIIVFNKIDLDADNAALNYKKLYTDAGYTCLLTSAYRHTGTKELFDMLKGRLTSVAGPSGVGKSSLINLFKGEPVMETGDVSKKTKRGKQTTRHTELVAIEKETFIMDTPGFSNTVIPDIRPEELGGFFPEFVPHVYQCRFTGCAHISEPDCKVKEAFSCGLISGSRYENYKKMYEELRRW